MSNPDRTLLDQINESWDRHVKSPQSGDTSSESGFEEVIETLHRSSHDEHPSPEFRNELRQRLLERSSSQNRPGDDAWADDDKEPASPDPVPISTKRNGADDMERSRRRWFSHLGELAAIIVILIVAAVGVAYWQSSGDDTQPGTATGDETETTAAPTPEPVRPGSWENLSFDDAQLITPFQVRMPESIPDGYEFSHADVFSLSVLMERDEVQFEPRDDGDDWVTAVLEFHSEDSGDLIELAQQNMMAPGMTGEQPEIAVGDGDVIPPVEFSRGDLSVDGIDILHTYFQMGDQPESGQYTWFQDGLTIHLTAPVEERNEPDEQIMAMIASLIENRESDAEPPVARQIFGTDDGSPPVQEPGQPVTHTDLSLDQAREVLPFELIDPSDAHPDYTLDSITVFEPPAGDRFEVIVGLVHQDEPMRSISITIQNTYLSPQIFPERSQPADPDEDLPETPDPVQQEIKIDGLTAVHGLQYNLGGDEITIYAWHQDGLAFSIYSMTSLADEDASQIDPAHIPSAEDIETLVTGLIEARASDETPEQPEIVEPSEGHEPRPDGGERQVTYEEALEVMPFKLIDSDVLPADMSFAGAVVRATENGDPVGPDHPHIDQPNTVSIHYAGPPGQDEMLILEIVQTTDAIPNPEGEIIEISGQEVEVVGGTMGTGFQIAWIWTVDEIEYGVMLTFDNPDGHETLDDFQPDQIPEADLITPIIESTLS